MEAEEEALLARVREIIPLPSALQIEADVLHAERLAASWNQTFEIANTPRNATVAILSVALQTTGAGTVPTSLFGVLTLLGTEAVQLKNVIRADELAYYQEVASNDPAGREAWLDALLHDVAELSPLWSEDMETVARLLMIVAATSPYDAWDQLFALRQQLAVLVASAPADAAIRSATAIRLYVGVANALFEMMHSLLPGTDPPALDGFAVGFLEEVHQVLQLRVVANLPTCLAPREITTGAWSTLSKQEKREFYRKFIFLVESLMPRLRGRYLITLRDRMQTVSDRLRKRVLEPLEFDDSELFQQLTPHDHLGWLRYLEPEGGGLERAQVEGLPGGPEEEDERDRDRGVTEHLLHDLRVHLGL